MNSLKYLNSLNIISGVGPQKIKMLLAHFSDLETAWKADLAGLRSAKIGEKLAERIAFERGNISPDEEWEKLEKERIQMLTIEAPEYPKLLKEIPNPPYILYAKGKIDYLNSLPMISIVGSRKYTSYGSQAAENFSRELVSAGIAVVSGMAFGIDTFAHRGALNANGKTIAVLGNGLDDASIYPRNNFNLSREIAENGTLLSEYPIGTAAGALTFPARNRIVAGLSFGTLVVEAGEASGALITAQMALDYGREVFSIPGSIFSPQSLGANNLIKKGARLASSIQDILEEFDFADSSKKEKDIKKIPSSENEKIILGVLSADPIHIDNIVRISKLGTADASATISMMEIKGWVKNIGGQNYILL